MEKYEALYEQKREIEKTLYSIEDELSSLYDHLKENDCIALSVHNRKNDMSPCHVPQNRLKELQNALQDAGLLLIKTIPQGHEMYEYHNNFLKTKCRCISFDQDSAPYLYERNKVIYRCNHCKAEGINEIGSFYQEERINLDH